MFSDSIIDGQEIRAALLCIERANRAFEYTRHALERSREALEQSSIVLSSVPTNDVSWPCERGQGFAGRGSPNARSGTVLMTEPAAACATAD